jgi:4-amino-4-deoxy-L-arabinose transferase-like glycosyltransferase
LDCVDGRFCQYTFIEKSASSLSCPSNQALAVLAVVIIFAALCFRLGYLPLLAPDEGRNAEVGHEMMVSGSWLVPTYNGLDYLDKPAFYFKLVGLSLGLLGHNEAAARVPSAVFAVALTALVFAFCRKVYSTRCGLLAAIVVGTTPLFLAFARTVIFDMMLAFFVCGAIFAGYLAETAEGKARRNWYLLGAASAGFATLVKGPVGFMVPVLVLLIFNRVDGRRGAWKRLFGPWNFVLFLAITLPWFVGLCLVHRDFFHYGVVEESLGRFTSAKTIQRTAPFYFFPLIILSTFVPWSILLPEASVAAWKERWTKTSADRLCLVWSVVVVIFFSLSQSKLPHYILSVTVSSGILIARLFDTALRFPESRPARITRHASLAFVVLSLLMEVVVLALAGMYRLPVLAQLPSLLARVLRIAETDVEQIGRGAPPLAVLLLVLGIAAWLAWRRRNVWISFLCLALFAPLGANMGLEMVRTGYEAKSGRRMAEKLSAVPAGTELVCFQCFPNGLLFYLKRPITLISLDGHELTSGYIVDTLSTAPQWPAQIVRLPDFNSWLASHKTPIYLIVRDTERVRLEGIGRTRGAAVETLTPGFLGIQLPAAPGS